MQGSIQQLVLKSDPTAPDDQCEEDDPYVSVSAAPTKFSRSPPWFSSQFWAHLNLHVKTYKGITAIFWTAPPSSGQKQN